MAFMKTRILYYMQKAENLSSISSIVKVSDIRGHWTLVVATSRPYVDFPFTAMSALPQNTPQHS